MLNTVSFIVSVLAILVSFNLTIPAFVWFQFLINSNMFFSSRIQRTLKLQLRQAQSLVKLSSLRVLLTWQVSARTHTSLCESHGSYKTVCRTDPKTAVNHMPPVVHFLLEYRHPGCKFGCHVLFNR